MALLLQHYLDRHVNVVYSLVKLRNEAQNSQFIFLINTVVFPFLSMFFCRRQNAKFRKTERWFSWVFFLELNGKLQTSDSFSV